MTYPVGKGIVQIHHELATLAKGKRSEIEETQGTSTRSRSPPGRLAHLTLPPILRRTADSL